VSVLGLGVNPVILFDERVGYVKKVKNHVQVFRHSEN